MSKQLKLSDLLQDAVQTMSPSELANFRRALLDRLPEAVQEAAEQARASRQEGPGRTKNDGGILNDLAELEKTR